MYSRYTYYSFWDISYFMDKLSAQQESYSKHIFSIRIRYLQYLTLVVVMLVIVCALLILTASCFPLVVWTQDVLVLLWILRILLFSIIITNEVLLKAFIQLICILHYWWKWSITWTWQMTMNQYYCNSSCRRSRC